MVGDPGIARLQAVGAADALAEVDRLVLTHGRIDVEHPRLVVQRRIGDLDIVVARVARIGRADLADEAGDRSIHGLAGRSVEIHAFVLASPGVAVGSEGSAAETIAAAHLLTGGVGEVVLAITVDVDAAPDQLLGRRGRRPRSRHAQRGIGVLDATLKRRGARRVRLGGRLGRKADESAEHRDRQDARAPHAAMA